MGAVRVVRRVVGAVNGARLTSLGVALTLALGCVGFAVGRGTDVLNVAATSGTAWLANDGRGSVSQVDGATGRTGAEVLLGGSAGHPLQVVQQGGSVLVRDPVTGLLTRIDLGQLTAGASISTPTGSVVVGSEAATYLVDLTSTGATVQRIDPVTLGPLGGPVRLPGSFGRPVVDADGTLWLPEPAAGVVVPVTQAGAGTPVRVGGQGTTVVLALAGGQPIAVDVAARTVTRIGPDGSENVVTLPAAAPGQALPLIVPATSTGPSVPLVAPGSVPDLVLVDPASATTRTIPLSADVAGHDLGQPVQAGSRVFIPDYTTGSALVYDAASGAPAADVTVTGRPGPFDIQVVDGIVYFNDPSGSDAVVVTPDGQVHRVAKTGPGIPTSGGTAPVAPQPAPGNPGGAAGRSTATSAASGSQSPGSQSPGSQSPGSQNAGSTSPPPAAGNPTAAAPAAGPPTPAAPAATPPPTSGAGQGSGIGVPPSGPAAPAGPTAPSATAPSGPAPAGTAPAGTASAMPVPPSAPPSGMPPLSPPRSSTPTHATTPPPAPAGTAPPLAPTGVRVTLANGALDVSWNPASSGGPVTSYAVTTNPAGGTQQATGATSVRITGLDCKNIYAVTVAAAGPGGRVAAPPVNSRECTAPSAPQNVTVTHSGGDTLVVHWTAPADDGGDGALSYQVTWAVSGGSTTTKKTTATSMTFGNLVPGHVYTVTVAAVNAAGAQQASPVDARAGSTAQASIDLTLFSTASPQKPCRPPVSQCTTQIPKDPDITAAAAFTARQGTTFTTYCQVSGPSIRNDNLVYSGRWIYINSGAVFGWANSLWFGGAGGTGSGLPTCPAGTRGG